VLYERHFEEILPKTMNSPNSDIRELRKMYAADPGQIKV
jgi:hypothetical protein